MTCSWGQTSCYCFRSGWAAATVPKRTRENDGISVPLTSLLYGTNLQYQGMDPLPQTHILPNPTLGQPFIRGAGAFKERNRETAKKPQWILGAKRQQPEKR